LGSVVLMTDKDRNIIERSEYEPYGSLLNRSVTDGPGYTGHVMDAATGLTYMQQRYYAPDIGSFLSTDPVAVGSEGRNFNRYAYAANNPYRFIDPDGRCDTSFCQFWGGVGRAVIDSSVAFAPGGPSVYGTVDTSSLRDLGPVFGPPASSVGQGGYKFGSALIVGEGLKGFSRGTGGLLSTESKLSDSTLVARGGSATGANSAVGLAKGIGDHPAGVRGFSAESANGASLCELCINVKHNQVGVTTVGEIRAAGGDVISTRGVSPNHATVTGISGEDAAGVFNVQKNPVPPTERKL
jgi:RHS repeat-associated protein